VTLGRSKVMNLQPAMIVDPTPNYDCHINQLKPSPTDALNIQNNRSQVNIQWNLSKPNFFGTNFFVFGIDRFYTG